MLSMILLVVVLVAQPSYGARIPDTNEKSSLMINDVGSVPTIVFPTVPIQNSTNGNTNLRTDNARPAPPKNATFITECVMPDYFPGDMAGLCWQNETTVLALEKNRGGRIIKFDIDLKLKYCKWSVLYTNVPGQRLSCPSDGEIYIADGDNKVVRIIKDGKVTKWAPEYAQNTYWGGIAVNDHLIAQDFERNPINVYNRQRQIIYQLNSEANPYSKDYLSISPSSPPSSPSYLVSSAPYHSYIFIHDLINHQTIKVGGYGTGRGSLDKPWSTSFDASEKYILVCEEENHRISVFTVGGMFVHWLKFGRGGTDTKIYRYHDTIHREGKPSLLAVELRPSVFNKFKIYSLST